MIRKIIKKYSKKNIFIKKIRRIYVLNRNKILRIYYNNLPIDDNVIVFSSFVGRNYSDSPRAIYEAMINDSRFNDYRFVWSVRKTKKYKHLLNNPRTSIVKLRTPKYYKAMATSRYWVENSQIPLTVKKRPSQVYIQCWHGTPLKILRLDQIKNRSNLTKQDKDIVKKNEMDVFRYDYLLSPSRFTTNKLTSAFDLVRLDKESIIFESGYPRNDILYNYTKAYMDRVKNNFNIPANKKILLYAPTFRDTQHHKTIGYTYDIALDFDKMKQNLGEEWVILFRPHYYIASSFDFDKYVGFIYDASKYDDISDLYIISDVLMTDYSSVFFDYANLRRPIIFYMYDKDEYKDSRGFYIDLESLPGPIVGSNDDIIHILNNLDDYQKNNYHKYKTFVDKFAYIDDGNSTKRVLNEVFHSKGNN